MLMRISYIFIICALLTACGQLQEEDSGARFQACQREEGSGARFQACQQEDGDSVWLVGLRQGALQVLARSYLDLNMLDSAETVYRQIAPGDDVHLAYIVQSNLARIALRRMGATPEGIKEWKRFDFTHTIKTKPKAPRKDAAVLASSTAPIAGEAARVPAEAEQSLYGEYNDQQLGIRLDPLDDAYTRHTYLYGEDARRFEARMQEHRCISSEERTRMNAASVCAPHHAYATAHLHKRF